jgi:outer-membrane receptor for ferric coprogen and ferric-rhodotorulic acid
VAGINLEQVHDASYGAHYGLPTELDGTPLPIARSRNFGANWSSQNDLEQTLFLRGTHVFESGWKVEAQLTKERFDTHALESVPGRTRDPATVANIYLFSQIEDWQNDHWSLDVYAHGDLELFGRSHQLMVGFNGARKKHLGSYYTSPEPLAQIDLATWDSNAAPDPYSQGMRLEYASKGDYNQYGGFTAVRVSLSDSLHLIVGSRVSWTEQEWEGLTDSKESGELTPYAGLVWDFAEHLSAYASYSDIFEPHTVGTRDLNGDVLEPKVGENYEAGIKLEAFDSRLNGSLAFFRLDQTNLAEPDFSGEVPGICGGLLDPCSKATGLVRSQGVELSVAGEVARGWQIYGGLTQLEHEYRTGDTAGERYDTTTPRRTLQLAATYTAPDNRWSLGASARNQSRVFTDDVLYFMPEQAYLIEQPAYTVVGVFGGVQIAPGVRLNAAVDNLFDKSYWSGLSWPVHGQVFGDSRRARLTLRAEF